MALTTSYQRLGQTYLGKSGGSLYVRIYAKYSAQDIENNRTYVFLQARAYYENGTYITDNQASGNVSGAGLTKNSGSLSTIYTGETTIATTEGWVYHNSDGKKSISASAYLSFPNWGWSGTASGSADLPTIPRHASITAAPNFNDEQNPTINYSNPAGNAITSIKACIADANGEIIINYRDISKTGSSYTFNLTDEEREALRNATLTSNTKTIKFYVTSVIGGTTKYSNLTKTLTIINATPELTISAKDTGGYSVPLTGDENKIIKGFNYVNVSMSSTLKKGATIKSQSITNGSQKINGSSGGFSNAEDNTFIFSLTDSRGNTVTKNITLDMVDYIKLTCNLEAKNPTADGNMVFKISGNYFKGNFGTVDNTLAVEFRYKENDGDYSEWIAAEPIPTISGNTYETIINLTGLNYRSSYTFQARAIDKTITILTTEKKVRTIPVYDWGENDFNVNGELKINDIPIIDLIYPVGSIYMAVNYFDPATIFGGEWERIMDKFLLGSGAIYASGQEGGEAAHTLTVDEIPSHNHGLYNYNVNGNNLTTGAVKLGESKIGWGYNSITTSNGGGKEHNNMPPYLTVNIWKRIA